MIKICLQGKGLFGYCDGTQELPNTPKYTQYLEALAAYNSLDNDKKDRPEFSDAVEKEKAKLDTWELNKQQARSFLLGFMEDKIQIQFVMEEEPKSIWEGTKERFGLHGFLEDERLINNIVQLKLSACKGVQEYCDKFNAALEELSRGSGERMPEKYATVHWLNGLGDKYDVWLTTVHTEFRMRPDNKVKLEQLQAQLIDYAAAESKGNSFLIIGDKNKRRKRSKSRSPSNNKDAPRSKYELCGGGGYDKAKCYYADLSKAPAKWQPNKEVLQRIMASQKPSKSGSKPSRIPDPDDIIGVIWDSTYATISRSVWIFDTGTGHHICNDKSMFWDLERRHFELGAANATPLRVYGIGTVILRCSRLGSDDFALRLTDVCYAPDCPANLVCSYLLKEAGIYHDGKDNTLRSMTNDSLVASVPYQGRYNVVALAKLLVFVLVANVENKLLT